MLCLLKLVLYGNTNIIFTMWTITVSEIDIYPMSELYKVISSSSVSASHSLCKITFLLVLILRTAKLSWKD